MADKWTAINTFWNSFDIPAYDEHTVPDDATMPYITYEASITDFDDKIILGASIWYHGTSWQPISEKSLEISDRIGSGESVLYDNGRLWITKGSPFAQRLSNNDTPDVRRIFLQINAEFH